MRSGRSPARSPVRTPLHALPRKGDPTSMTGGRFEDLQPGDQVRIAQRIEADDEAAFAALCRDLNPIHLDDEAARRHGFPERLAHGLLIGALLLKTFPSLCSCDGF